MSIQPIPVDIAMAYNYGLEFQDLLVAYVRKANLPERETADVEHAHAGQRNMTFQAGKETVGIITLEKALPLDGFDGYFEAWYRDTKILPPSQYKRDGLIYTLDSSETGARVMTWDILEAYPRKLTYTDLDGGSEDPLLLTVELKVRECNLQGI